MLSGLRGQQRANGFAQIANGAVRPDKFGDSRVQQLLGGLVPARLPGGCVQGEEALGTPRVVLQQTLNSTGFTVMRDPAQHCTVPVHAQQVPGRLLR